MVPRPHHSERAVMELFIYWPQITVQYYILTGIQSISLFIQKYVEKKMSSGGLLRFAQKKSNRHICNHIPKDPNLRQTWLALSCSAKDGNFIYICHRHFSASQVSSTEKKNTLKRDAVPDQNLPQYGLQG